MKARAAVELGRRHEPSRCCRRSFEVSCAYRPKYPSFFCLHKFRLPQPGKSSPQLSHAESCRLSVHVSAPVIWVVSRLSGLILTRQLGTSLEHRSRMSMCLDSHALWCQVVHGIGSDRHAAGAWRREPCFVLTYHDGRSCSNSTSSTTCLERSCCRRSRSKCNSSFPIACSHTEGAQGRETPADEASSQHPGGGQCHAD